MTTRAAMAAALVLAAGVAAAGAAAAECRDDRLAVSGDWGRAVFTVAVVDDAASRARGLMFVEAMPAMAGMLFVYDQPQPVAFWMKNTLIPLDMLFAGEDGVISHVHEGAVPHDETAIPGGDAVQFVLEINAGMVARLGIGDGDQMAHPAIGNC